MSARANYGGGTVAAELLPILRAAEAAGWRPVLTGKRHVRMVPPAGALQPTGAPCVPVTLAGTAGDRRSWLNARAQLRRQGIKETTDERKRP